MNQKKKEPSLACKTYSCHLNSKPGVCTDPIGLSCSGRTIPEISWQDSWPTEPGYWWFYGWPLGREGNKPELCLVDVWPTAVKDDYMYVTQGYCLYKEEGAEGKWLKVELPKLPQLETK